MRHSWRIFLRDVRRLGRVPRAWIILIGLVVTPAMYSWVNIAAFWDPYEATENIKVAVVNEDRGGYTPLTGKVEVGARVVDKLRENHKIGWQFMDAQGAERALNRGDVYATITIPADFSRDLVGIVNGVYAQPRLEYRVNEKLNAIAAKITDASAAGLDKEITAQFRQSVAAAASQQVHDKGIDVERRLITAANSSSSAFARTAAEIDAARARIGGVSQRVAQAGESVRGARGTVGDVGTALADAAQALQEIQPLITQAQAGVGDFTDRSTAAFVQGATAVADGTAQARGLVADLSASLTQASGRVDFATAQAGDATRASDAALAELSALAANPALSPQTAASLRGAAEQLRAGNASTQRVVDSLATLNSQTRTATDHLAQGAAEIDRAAADTKATAQALRGDVDKLVPQINRAMGSVAATTQALSVTLASQQDTMREADSLLEAVAQQLETTADTLGGFDANLASLRDGLSAVGRDVQVLKSASNSQVLQDITGLNSQDIGQFFAQPIAVSQETVYPVRNYGSAMAALFTNLSLWIGAFVLMVIFRVEVDREGLHRVTVAQAYVGRFLLMAAMVTAQALVVSTGEVIMGVQTVNPVAFIGTSVLIAWAYLSIIYALSTSLGHLGRGLCVVMVIVQIPGASGLYPIELMPDFFRALYPLLPFTYGIDALRETIGGFYGAHYWKYMGVLLAMFVVFFLGGIVARRALSHFNLLFNRELASSGIYDYENVHVVGPGYRIADVIQALDSRSALKEDLARRTHDYGAWLRVVVAIGVGGAMALLLAAWAVPSQKPLWLGLFAAWCLGLIGVLLTFDYIRRSLTQSAELVTMDEEQLKHPARVAAGGQEERDSEDA